MSGHWHIETHPETEGVALFRGDEPHGRFDSVFDAIDYTRHTILHEAHARIHEETQRRRRNQRRFDTTILVLIAMHVALLAYIILT